MPRFPFEIFRKRNFESQSSAGYEEIAQATELAHQLPHSEQAEFWLKYVQQFNLLPAAEQAKMQSKPADSLLQAKTALEIEIQNPDLRVKEQACFVFLDLALAFHSQNDIENARQVVMYVAEESIKTFDGVFRSKDIKKLEESPTYYVNFFVELSRTIALIGGWELGLKVFSQIPKKEIQMYTNIHGDRRHDQLTPGELLAYLLQGLIETKIEDQGTREVILEQCDQLVNLATMMEPTLSPAQFEDDYSIWETSVDKLLYKSSFIHATVLGYESTQTKLDTQKLNQILIELGNKYKTTREFDENGVGQLQVRKPAEEIEVNNKTKASILVGYAKGQCIGGEVRSAAKIIYTASEFLRVTQQEHTSLYLYFFQPTCALIAQSLAQLGEVEQAKQLMEGLNATQNAKLNLHIEELMVGKKKDVSGDVVARDLLKESLELQMDLQEISTGKMQRSHYKELKKVLDRLFLKDGFYPGDEFVAYSTLVISRGFEFGMIDEATAIHTLQMEDTYFYPELNVRLHDQYLKELAKVTDNQGKRNKIINQIKDDTVRSEAIAHQMRLLFSLGKYHEAKKLLPTLTVRFQAKMSLELGISRILHDLPSDGEIKTTSQKNEPSISLDELLKFPSEENS